MPSNDFIQNMSQALNKCLKQQIKVDNLGYFKNTILDFEKFFVVLGANEYLERLEGKIRKCLFFYAKML